MRRSSLIALLALVVLGGCNELPSGGSYATVYGRVFDAASGAPLGGVAVTVDAVDVVTTAADGTYRAENVPVGPTDVAVAGPTGYEVADPSTLTFSVRPGDRYELDVALRPSAPTP